MAAKKASKKNTNVSKYDVLMSVREDIIKFAEDYWDNGGLYNDGDLDDIIAKIETICK